MPAPRQPGPFAFCCAVAALLGGVVVVGPGRLLELVRPADPAATAGRSAGGTVPPPALSTYAQKLAGVREAHATVLQNIAHAHTPGYQSLRPRFADADPGGIDAGRPTLVRDLQPGPPVSTDRWLDLAIDGPGYFVLDDPHAHTADGLTYSRVGRLFINARQQLVHGHPDGPPLEPRVVIPDQVHDLRFDPDGLILAHDVAADRWLPVGQLHLARFHHTAGLRRLGADRLAATPASGPPLADTPGHLGLGTLVHRHLEGSNVNLAAELNHLADLRAWGESLATAAGVDPGFAPPLNTPLAPRTTSPLASPPAPASPHIAAQRPTHPPLPISPAVDRLSLIR